MKRYTGQKALYEAISRSRAKAQRGSILERFLPETAKQEKPPAPEGPLPDELTQAPAEPPVGEGPSTDNPALGNPKEPSRPLLDRLREAIIAKEDAKLERPEQPEKTEVPPEKPAAPQAVKPWAVEEVEVPAPLRRIPMWWRLKPLQLNEGRIEISVSYHIAIAAALVVLLVIVAGFRLGQKYPAKAKAGAETKTPARAAAENAVTGTATGKAAPTSTQGAASPTGGTAQATGDNWIVLARHRNEADLEPVVAHFAKSGIVLKIYELGWLRQQLGGQGLTAAGLPSGDGFLLVTSDFYVNPQSPGTDGYKMIQTIASVGATYKAPKGKDPFTPNLFKDAYGMKISRVK